jgi:hypothetical protein
LRKPSRRVLNSWWRLKCERRKWRRRRGRAPKTELDRITDLKNNANKRARIAEAKFAQQGAVVYDKWPTAKRPFPLRERIEVAADDTAALAEEVRTRRELK